MRDLHEQRVVIPDTSGRRGLALVVDDEPANRLLLEMMLRREGYEVITAENGVRATEVFVSRQIDIVFMDVMMPEMDGYEATRQIKSLCGDTFVPVIFLTALRDTDAIVRAIAAGGDDLLGKPFNFAVLKARIQAMERVRDLYRAVADKHASLSMMHQQVIQDQAFAEQIFQRVLTEGCQTPACVSFLQKSADTFCGDLVLSAILPSGQVRILVADFTGHGLAAAVGSIPVADEFKRANEAGLDDFKLLHSLNDRLYKLLPADVFMAACLITLEEGSFSYWNGGMPASFLQFSDRVEELSSKHLALGILPSLSDTERPENVSYEGGQAILIVTDGLGEACDESGRRLGDRPVKSCVRMATHSVSSMLESVNEMVEAHVGKALLRDDLTAVAVDIKCFVKQLPGMCKPDFIKRVTVEVFGRQLIQSDLRCHLNFVSDFGASPADLVAMETVTTELFNNALEHGLLGLDSRLKHDPDGFDAYYKMRGEALSNNPLGHVLLVFSLCRVKPDSAGKYTLEIRVTDSGSGFQSDKWLGWGSYSNLGTVAPVPWGRGISLVAGLCDKLEYNTFGNEATALYSWLVDPGIS